MEKEVGHLFPWVIFHSLATSYQRLSLHRFRGQLAQTLLQFSGGAASAVKTWDVTSCPTKTGNIRHRCGTCICMWLLVCVYVYVCVYACIDIRICIYTHICCIHFAKMKQLIWERWDGHIPHKRGATIRAIITTDDPNAHFEHHDCQLKMAIGTKMSNNNHGACGRRSSTRT